MATIKIEHLENYKMGENWLDYTEKLQHYFSVNLINEERKVCVLLTFLEPDVYEMLKKLCHPQLPKNKSFEELVSILNRQLKPSVSLFHKRIEFDKLKQTTEGVSDWFRKVKQLGSSCEFESSTSEDWIKNKFITGMRPGIILEALCEKGPNESLDNLLTLALKTENCQGNFSKMGENLREIVNGSMLSQFNGKKVTIIGLITNVNSNGLTFDIKSVDDSTVKVNLRKPSQDALEGYVEVHGTAQGGSTVICDHFVQFPISTTHEEFDSANHNTLTTLLQTVQEMWKTTV